MRLKNDLGQYGNAIRDKVKHLVPGTLLDKVTLKVFIETNELLRSIEEQHKWSGQTALVEPPPESLDFDLKALERLGITHVDSLGHALDRHKDHITRAVQRCEQVDYGPEFCHAPQARMVSLDPRSAPLRG